MSIASPSPICLVKNGAGFFVPTINGVNVTAGATITIKLQDPSGVNVWALSCIGTDEHQVPVVITGSLTIDQVSKTATFTAPVAACALIFQSSVNNGVTPNGVLSSDYTTTFGIWVPTNIGSRLIATGQEFEGNAKYGWITQVNPIIATAGAAV